MAIRIGGMYSGLDTDALVKELTSAYSTKKDSIQKQKDALEWKQESWDTLNKDIYDFYAASLSNIRFDNNNSYEAVYSDDKAVSIENPSKDNVGTYTLKVESLAQSGYLTGKELDKSVTNDTQISALIEHPHAGSKISVNNTVIEITDDMTVGQLAAKIAEINNTHANFDSTNHRFFVSATKPGSEYDFSIKAEDEGGKEILKALGIDEDGAARIHGSDAKIEFNGLSYTNSSNIFNINGVKIKANSVSTSSVNVTIGAGKKDSKNVKDFVNSYNELLEKLQTSYNKNSSKTYMPLTDSEKEAMSDRDIEKWEKTGKENILAKDESLRKVIDLLKGVTSKTYTIDGEQVSLASIGITTGSYFTTSADKRGTLEFDETKFQEELEKNPDKVNKLIKAVGTDLYDKLTKDSKSSSMRSIYSFYNDKELKKQLENYKKKLDDWDQKIAKMEDKYYKQFTAMETMLSKMSSNSSYLSSLFSV